MKKGAILLVNTRNGYVPTPRRFPSISEAVREGKESMGFWWRVIRAEDNKQVRQGFCND